MPKIVVADDNSNIQKMVGLALKDQGIDVVAVGNGEAAVRKISEIRPDLVLADVFMPVRNGYEVCQYVKADPSLAHIPVILLVGAFDPLDEQEAQRVGADGVLKKPFVPPDPLISMVKSALARAVVAKSVQSPATPVVTTPKSADPISSRRESTPAAPFMVPAVASPEKEAFIPPEEQSFVDDVPSQAAPVHFETGAHPLAFGSLLETPAAENEEDIAFVAPVHPAIERDWKSLDDEAEDTEEEEAAPSWRRDGAEPEFEDDGGAPAVPDWRENLINELPATNPPQAVLDSAAVKSSYPEIVTNTVKESPLAEIPSAVPFSGDAWAAAIASNAAEKSSGNGTKPGAASYTPDVEYAPVSQPEHTEAAVQSESAVTEHFATPAASLNALDSGVNASSQDAHADSLPWAAANPWGSQAQETEELSTSWETPAAELKLDTEPDHKEVSESAYASTASELDQEYTPASAAEASPVLEALASASTLEAIREEVADVTQGSSHAMDDPGQPELIAESAVEQGPATPQANMDEMVAKVLANLSPEVLQAVTREILKPVIQAMVREEVESKKP